MKQECIPARCVPPAAVAVTGGGCLPGVCVGLETPREQAPPGSGPGDPPGSRHSPEQVPPRSRLPPGADPLGAGTSPMDRQTHVKT